MKLNLIDIILRLSVFLLLLSGFIVPTFAASLPPTYERPRVIVTTDGEADDRCSMIRFLLTSNEFEVEAIINSSSQFHWVGGQGWHAFHPVEWVKEQIDLYAQVYPNLTLHDKNYPSPDYLLSKWKIGNIKAAGESDERTQGAEFIAQILLDETDSRPVWIQAWGGTNTIAKALKIIQSEHPEKMQTVANKMRLFLIWEQDQTYQEYIRPHWEHLNVLTIISDQFDSMAYIWPKVLPAEIKPYFEAPWMQTHILQNHGPLAAAYEALNGAFHAEGDTPAFLHTIPTGLANLENPNWGGWGGRYVHVRHNVWMDPPPADNWKHPDGRRTIDNSWAKKFENVTDPDMVKLRTQYFKPIWRWLDTVQNDFAARADWSVKPYAEANHHPVIKLSNTQLNIQAKAGQVISLDASQSYDPDGDKLSYKWWFYAEASDYQGSEIAPINQAIANFTVPRDAKNGDEIHLICEVADSGKPKLVKYQRIIVNVI